MNRNIGVFEDLVVWSKTSANEMPFDALGLRTFDVTETVEQIFGIKDVSFDVLVLGNFELSQIIRRTSTVLVSVL